MPHFGRILSGMEGFLRKNPEAVSRRGSMVSEAVKTGLSIDQMLEYFIIDVAKHAGKSEDEHPDHIRRILKRNRLSLAHGEENSEPVKFNGELGSSDAAQIGRQRLVLVQRTS